MRDVVNGWAPYHLLCRYVFDYGVCNMLGLVTI